jgi:Flagellar P-ring protein
MVGCLEPHARLQKDDEAARDKDLEVETVGDVTEVSNANPTLVSGVGLVTGLEGTGGGTPPGTYRTMLENELKKKNVDNLRQVLDSDNNALVLVTAQIPPGAHKADPLDVDITLPPGSRVKSLRGGYLQECVLYNYDTAKNLNPDYDGDNRLLRGHILAKAKGPLLVGFGPGEEAAKVKAGRIWGGGVSLIDRPFFLILKNDKQFARISNAVAERINQTFRDDSRKRLVVLGQVTDRVGDRFSGPGGQGNPGTGVTAKAINRESVYVRVPWEYRHNPARYLRVARLVPLRDGPEVHNRYRRRLEENLLDPAQTISAALRLEALGQESIPGLKAGLKSDHALVRFCSAEALAYLSSPTGGEELARLARNQPNLRGYCLTALASLNEAVCQIELTKLMFSRSAETRYGAFRALYTLDGHNPDVRGELLNETFWLHRVAPQSPPLVHLSSSRRAEIVLFGEDATMVPPFYLVCGPEFTATASAHDDKCTISRFSSERGNVQRRQCSLKLEDILRTLADLGGTYPDAAELVVQADKYRGLSCRVRVDALAQVLPVEDLAKNAKNPEFWKEVPDTEEEVTRAPDDAAAKFRLSSQGVR